MIPIVDGLATEFEGPITVLKLDASLPENEKLQASYGLRGHPTFLVLDWKGHVTAQFIGPQAVETLQTAIQNVVNEAP